jgi:FkbM family methyltransferase
MMSAEYQSKRGPDSTLREVEIDGVKLFPWRGDHLIGDHIQSGATYEPNVLPLFLQSLSEGDHILDVGANVGIFSLLAAKKVGPQGRVYAIEPVARNVRSLCAGIHRNGFDNVALFPLAASDRSSVIAILRQPDSSNGIVDAHAGDSDAVDFVPTQRLDFLLHGIQRLDVIKMDIEGHEPIAWTGLKTLVAKFKPLIFSEFSPVAIRNHSHTDPKQYLAELFECANGPIESLARDGRRVPCNDAAAVMEEWESANRAMGLKGELHLDLRVDCR